MDISTVLAAGDELRDAAQYWKAGSKIDAAYGSWPQNRAAAQRFLDALKAWDALMDTVPPSLRSGAMSAPGKD